MGQTSEGRELGEKVASLPTEHRPWVSCFMYILLFYFLCVCIFMCTCVHLWVGLGAHGDILSGSSVHFRMASTLLTQHLPSHIVSFILCNHPEVGTIIIVLYLR